MKWQFSDCVPRNLKIWPTHLKVAKEEEETKQAGLHVKQLHVSLSSLGRPIIVGLKKVSSSFFCSCLLILSFETTTNLHIFLHLLSATFHVRQIITNIA